MFFCFVFFFCGLTSFFHDLDVIRNRLGFFFFGTNIDYVITRVIVWISLRYCCTCLLDRRTFLIGLSMALFTRPT